ncbi:MAG: ATP-binding cassette domain-containing protein [Candidatus Heimdallarchaeaceae archaeon]
MLKLINLSVKRGSFSLADINLEVKEGEIVVFLGLSGSGKTTLLETILGMHHPEMGQIIYNGEDITKKKIQSRRIAYVPQDSLLYPHMTVYENVEYGLKLQQSKKEKKEELKNKVHSFLKIKRKNEKSQNQLLEEEIRKEKIEKILTYMGIKDKETFYPYQLSGGEKQRVSIARALILDFPLILMDEPLIGIDIPKAHQIRRLIKDSSALFKKTIIYVTHQLPEASFLATRIAILEKGRIIRIGSSEEILADPQSQSVAQLLNFENIFNATIRKEEKGVLAVIRGEKNQEISIKIPELSTVSEGDKKVLAIRPEDIIISPKPLEGISARNCLKAIITEISPNLEGTVKIRTLCCGTNFSSLLTRNSLEELELSKGKEVFLVFKATAVIFLN